MFLILFTFSPIIFVNNFSDAILLLILYIPTLYFIPNINFPLKRSVSQPIPNKK